MYAELEHILLTLGERLEKYELEPIMTQCCPPEDEEGFVKYEPFVEAHHHVRTLLDPCLRPCGSRGFTRARGSHQPVAMKGVEQRPGGTTQTSENQHFHRESS